MPSDESRWCLIESDPAVFREIIQTVGVKGVSVEDLIMLDSSMLEQYEHVYGLVLLFKWQSSEQAPPLGTVVKDAPVFFAKQVIHNACATLAIINTLCNYSDQVELGPKVQRYLSFCQELDPEMRGSLLDSFDELREAHNSFAPHSAFTKDGPSPKDADVYHFASFVYRHGHIWELDGLQEGPLQCREATEANYREALVEVVQRRIDDIAAKDTTGAGQGISFSLMTIVDDPVTVLEKKIAALQAEEKPTTALDEELAEMLSLRKKDKEANVRRRHDYNAMIVALLKSLAERGKLEKIVAEVQAKASK
ncbi:ubiquitin carboxyl-terminal hydrolase [Leishmania donovani]|uniref:Ubiquitin carboxyl-terminal hydrolase n=1 Tax=Leishmania donovani TaxID=5661 RepID=A0A3S7WY30_LEIDO|nr:ubiquitin carboxyl-terminal hydrolase, putative [Leishmania donovani]AYU79124.1 ubiquitin carboxyl-terminal hydrolase, putative [Leishmania donovani]TPP44857.1 Ubiquitin carboxyl-terminal hydrolase, 1 family protein [Leishmania donovani]TPP52182.1 Ubiquitin carboxyl-terminal hydrolase, 1 family protein [Leishmania donovani]CAJ1989117.1 ubiquitin carboxyl-terminal hydrolase [Leishmania donovani]CBZ34430.1 ubiquitin carboxyl-terminal hydrolase, putative [Leishmania donovani]